MTEAVDIEAALPEGRLGVVIGSGIFAEWHAHGLGVEMRVRPAGKVWCGVSDARGEVPDSTGFDRAFERASAALEVMARRGMAK